MPWFSRSLSTLAAALALAATTSAMSAPLILSGSAGSVQAGQNITFTVSDQNPDDGFSASLGVYLADFSFNYDATVLHYAHSDVVNPADFLVAPVVTGATPDPDPNGSFHALLVGSASGSSPVDLFTITFTALKATSAGGTSLTVSLPDTGAYGDGKTFTPSSGGVVVTSVPEPEVWALVLAGALVATSMARRRKAQ